MAELPNQTQVPRDLATLIARLQNAGVDWDGENIADLLWLVNFIDPPEQAETPIETPGYQLKPGNPLRMQAQREAS